MHRPQVRHGARREAPCPPPDRPDRPPPLANQFPHLFSMTSTLLRCTLASLRLQGRAGLRRAAQQWWGGAAARPLSSSRVPGWVAAAAAVEVQQAEASAAATAQQQAQPPAAAPEAPAYRAHIDFKFVRDNVEAVAANCTARLSSADPHLVAQLYEQYVAAQQETDKLRAARNENSSAMKVSAAAAAACRRCLLPALWTFQAAAAILHVCDASLCAFAQLLQAVLPCCLPQTCCRRASWSRRREQRSLRRAR